MDRLTPTGGTEWMEVVPTGRMGEIQDISNATVFLFSDAASYITGQVLAVDGGNMHMSTIRLPYPQSVLDPEGTKRLIKGRL